MKVKNDLNNLPDTAKNVYDRLKEKYGITARATRMFEMLKYAFQVDEWVALDERLVTNGPFEAYIIDRAYEFINEQEIETRDIYDAILKAGDFVQSEKRMFESGHIDEVIWAIFLAITNNKN